MFIHKAPNFCDFKSSSKLVAVYSRPPIQFLHCIKSILFYEEIDPELTNTHFRNAKILFDCLDAYL